MKKPEKSTAREVNDMNNDLISRSALLEAIEKDHPPFYDGQDIADWQEKCIKDAPAVDAKAMLENNAYYPYCPHCGAKMDGGNKHV